MIYNKTGFNEQTLRRCGCVGSDRYAVVLAQMEMWLRWLRWRCGCVGSDGDVVVLAQMELWLCWLRWSCGCVDSDGDVAMLALMKMWLCWLRWRCGCVVQSGFYCNPNLNVFLKSGSVHCFIRQDREKQLLLKEQCHEITIQKLYVGPGYASLYPVLRYPAGKR